MVRRTRTQRKWDLLRRSFLGLAGVLLGLSIMAEPLTLGFVTVPQSPLLGILIIVIALLLSLAAILEHRRYLRGLAERASAPRPE